MDQISKRSETLQLAISSRGYIRFGLANFEYLRKKIYQEDFVIHFGQALFKKGLRKEDSLVVKKISSH